jgi:hypothetical protein
VGLRVVIGRDDAAAVVGVVLSHCVIVYPFIPSGQNNSPGKLLLGVLITPAEIGTMGGRPPTVEAVEVMRAIALHPEPVVAARDINEEIGLEPASALERLKSLADEGYLKKKQPGSSALVFWMSDKGRELLAEP